MQLSPNLQQKYMHEHNILQCSHGKLVITPHQEEITGVSRSLF